MPLNIGKKIYLSGGYQSIDETIRQSKLSESIIRHEYEKSNSSKSSTVTQAQLNGNNQTSSNIYYDAGALLLSKTAAEMNKTSITDKAIQKSSKTKRGRPTLAQTAFKQMVKTAVDNGMEIFDEEEEEIKEESVKKLKKTFISNVFNNICK